MEKSCDPVQGTQDHLSFWKRWIFPQKAADVNMGEQEGRKAGPGTALASHNGNGQRDSQSMSFGEGRGDGGSATQGGRCVAWQLSGGTQLCGAEGS